MFAERLRGLTPFSLHGGADDAELTRRAQTNAKLIDRFLARSFYLFQKKSMPLRDGDTLQKA